MTYDKPVVIFGAAELAATAHYVFAHGGGPEAVAFTADASFIKNDEFNGLPLVPFEGLPEKYPPSLFDMFVAAGYKSLNSVRAAKCAEAERLGYSLISYIHPGVYTWPDFTCGSNCLVLEGNCIQQSVKGVQADTL